MSLAGDLQESIPKVIILSAVDIPSLSPAITLSYVEPLEPLCALQ